MRLKGKKAFITGGSEGIGFAIAKRFLEEGAQVTLMGRSLEKLKKAQKELGSGVLVFPGDVTSVSDLESIYQNYYASQGNFDIVIANAGLAFETPLASATEEDVDRLLAANVKGVFFTIQKALPFLNENSSLVLVASLAAKWGMKNFSAYSATKAAVVSLAQSFAAELADRKIRVNSLSPGVVRTVMFESLDLPKEKEELWTKGIPLKRFAWPNEIADAAVFLASKESSYMTATDTIVDGGVSGISPLSL